VSGSDWDFTKYVDPPSTPSPSGEAAADPPSRAGFEPEPGASGPGGFEFSRPGSGDASRGAATLTSGRAPVSWLAACLAAVVIGGFLAVALGATSSWAIAAWVLSGPIAIGLLAAFTTFDTKARTMGVYSRQAWVKPLYVVCLVLCGIAVCIAALRIALWVGRW
jgi:fluoride ion exporter CrcB/FEX